MDANMAQQAISQSWANLPELAFVNLLSLTLLYGLPVGVELGRVVVF